MSLIENCALYLPVTKLDNRDFPSGTKQNGGLFSKATEVSVPSPDGEIVLKLTTGPELDGHLDGFRGYVAQAGDSEDAKAEANGLINGVNLLCGVILPAPVSMDSGAMNALISIAANTGGFLFVNDSILTANGYLVGPMAEPAERKPLATVQLDPEMIAEQHASASLEAKARRERTLETLTSKGFRCAASLPIERPERLRPAEEIAARMGAMSVMYLFLVAPEEFVSEAELRAIAAESVLAGAFTPREVEIFSAPRASAQEEHGRAAGWGLENIWGLAWAIGFEFTPEIDSGFIGEEVSTTLRYWMPLHDQTMRDVLGRVTPRTFDEVADLEDLFYCAHNAVRSAQYGSEDTVPAGFDPMADGGTVHERRHALTWCLQPGVSWEETDLST